jgi:hypothetical protein
MKNGSCASVDGGEVAGQAFEDQLGALSPDKRTRVLVLGGGPGGDVGRQFFDVAERITHLLLDSWRTGYD